MGKASRTKVEVNRREKIAAQRAAAKRTEQRRRILIAGGSVLAVIIIIVAFIVIKANSSPSKPAATTSSANGPTGSALASVVAKTTTVPASTLNSVGSGGGAVSATPMTIKGNPAALTSGGKPEMLYMGAEYCPYCAAERWSMIVALSRFGTFSGLATVHSGIKNGAGEAEPYPSTPTWTFVNANYTSKYLTFTPVEMQTNIPDPSNGSYTNLQTPTAAQDALINKYDVAPYTSETGAIPFIDFGNKYLIIGASYNPGVLSGLSWSTIATDLHNPSSPVAQAVNGTANYITAAICKMTGNQPASACTSVVQSLESKI
jgi:thiol-disulfide isomerase/thioredoxin